MNLWVAAGLVVGGLVVGVNVGVLLMAALQIQRLRRTEVQ